MNTLRLRTLNVIFQTKWNFAGDSWRGWGGLPCPGLGPRYGLRLRQPRERGLLRGHGDCVPGFFFWKKLNEFLKFIFNACQVFHICLTSGSSYFGLIKYSFVCPNGTMFQQKYFTCDWWYNVDCGASQDYYDLNNNLFKVDKYQNVAKIQVKYRQY